MLVFKFGGASVKDAEGIANLANVIKLYADQQLLIVVSAMGKTTNALEKLARAYADQTEEVQALYDEVKQYHYGVINDLFEPSNSVHDDVANTFVEIDWMLEDEPQDEFDFIYDQLVSVGELVSTRIVAAYLNKQGLRTKWVDARGYIHTDNTYREGVVQWDKTTQSIQQGIPPILQDSIVVTQGFLGGTSENFTTTLGREGSDYTASIFASCLSAESVTIWKDVPGVLNADPKLFPDTIKYDELTYTEAIEMTYYGASVIHPKTIKPLQNTNIPLLVKPFNDPQASGTVIKEDAVMNFVKPVIIVKQNQVLLSLSAKNYSFITEDQLSDIFSHFAKHHIKINVMQTSALSFSVCFDLDERRFEKLLRELINYNIKYNTGLTLLTTRRFKENTLKELTLNKTVLLEQVSRNTAQLVLK